MAQTSRACIEQRSPAINSFAEEIRAAILIARSINLDLLEERRRTPAQTLVDELARSGEFVGVTPICETFAPNFLQYTERKHSLAVKVAIISPPENFTFAATVAIYEGADGRRVEISVCENNPCNIRFFVCKELLHIHLSNDQNRTHTRGEFDRMVVELTNIRNLDHNTLSSQSLVDQAAYYGAIELLMPSSRLQLILDMGCTDPVQIAEIFRVPKSLVEQALAPVVRQHFNF